MNITMQLLHDEKGSMMVIALLIIVLLTIMGFAASRTSITELQIARNTIETRQEFYVSEGSMFEVANHVDKGQGNGIDYGITDISQPQLLTPTSNYDASDLPATYKTINDDINTPNWTDLVKEYDDTNWPIGNNDDWDINNKTYIYRVYYRGQGAMPKGYGTQYGTYIFDISVRKRNVNTNGDITYSSVINKGHRKIGPKNQ